MPTTLKYSWEQTPETVIIKVNVKGVSRRTLDVLVTDLFVKINSPPHYLAIDLSEMIDEKNSSNYEIDEHSLTLVLKKTERKIWKTLLFDFTTEIEQKEGTKTVYNKSVHKKRQERRNEAVDRKAQRVKKEREKRIEKKRKLEKKLFLEGWDKEKERKSKIEEEKERERQNVFKEVDDFQKDIDGDPKNEQKVGAAAIFKGILTGKNNKGIFEDLNDDEPGVDLRKDVPIRKHESTTVKTKFTPRLFTTFAREDRDVEMLKKYEIVKSRSKKRSRLVKNPQWMKDKGDLFYKRHDFEAAVNAYTYALENTDDLGESKLKLLCYANRSACFLKMKKFSDCVRDCDRFLMFQSDERVLRNEKDVDELGVVYLKVLARRGCSYFHTGQVEKAVKDYEKILQVEKDEGVIEDYKTMKKMVQGAKSDENNAANVKEKADDYFRFGEYNKAIMLYTQIEAHIDHKKNVEIARKCVSNRAVCYLKLNKLTECISDCDKIINDEDFRKDSYILLKSLVRRGTSYCRLGDFEGGYKDYEAAYRIVPDDKSIQADLDLISKRVQSQIQADWLKNRGDYFYSLQDYRAAVNCYGLAIEKDETNALFYSNRSQCFMKLKDYANVIVDIDKAFTVIPKDILRQHKEQLRRKKERKETVTDLDEIPVNTDMTKRVQLKLYIRRAAAYMEMGAWEKAKGDYDNALTINPNLKWVRDKISDLVIKIPKKQPQVQKFQKTK